MPAGAIDLRSRYGLTDSAEVSATLSRALADNRGPLYLAAGTYLVAKPIVVPSGTNLILDRDAVLRAAAVPWAAHGLLDVVGVHDVSISGGTLDGNLAANPLGMAFGVLIRDAENVRVINLSARNFPGSEPSGVNGGDGIVITGTRPSRNILVERCQLHGNVRQGISVTHADGVTIRGCDISGTRGWIPGAGIDLEPDPGFSVTNVHVLDNRLSGNHIGLLALGEQGGRILGEVRGIRVAGNRFEGNRYAPMVIQRAAVVSEGNVGL